MNSNVIILRDIPSLQTLCLRSVGGHACSAEESFSQLEGGTLSTASRLLRSFATLPPNNHTNKHNNTQSKRRSTAQDVDLQHPWIDTWQKTLNDRLELQPEYGSPALNVLQAYIDALVELGRMDDSRLGLHFFQEWKALVELGSNTTTTTPTKRNNNKRRKTNSNTQINVGSLSLHNAMIQQDTLEAMVESKMTQHLAVLDLTGIPLLSDDLLIPLLQAAPILQRLSIKNCRRLTSRSLVAVGEHLTSLVSLDVGGSYNLPASVVVETVAALPHLRDLVAAGLDWTDDTLLEVCRLSQFRSLGLGFLSTTAAGTSDHHMYYTAAAAAATSASSIGSSTSISVRGFKAALKLQSSSLQSLGLAFCENLVDAALLGWLGRHLPHLQALDVRGNAALTSLTGWYDGRATIAPVPAPSKLVVLGRYSGVTPASLEETKRIHPLQALELTCYLGAGGSGQGILRTTTLEEEDDGDEGGQ